MNVRFWVVVSNCEIDSSSTCTLLFIIKTQLDLPCKIYLFKRNIQPFVECSIWGLFLIRESKEDNNEESMEMFINLDHLYLVCFNVVLFKWLGCCKQE